MPPLSHFPVRFTLLLTLLAPPLSFAQDRVEAFGSPQRDFKGTAAFVGTFYDLKQSQTREPIKNAPKQYWEVIRQFIDGGFHEAKLDQFFRAGLPLYTNLIHIKSMDANAAPRAFGVEEVVEPRLWIIHYRAQVAPPRDGRYRLAGGADDVLLAAINGRMVLAGQYVDREMEAIGWESPPGNVEPWPLIDPRARWGLWLDLKADQPVDLDVIVGERPGGRFHAGLAFHEEGGSFRVTQDGKRVVLPVLELVPYGSPEAEQKPDAWRVFP
ncbi:MAG: hypothetical protein ACFCU4_05040 [Puniceicoccaceae bacterium]